MKGRISAFAFLAVTALLMDCLSPASAAKYFLGEPRQVRACVLLLPSTAAALPAYGPDGQNLNPYIFYVMDGRSDLRPESWAFVNPVAPPTVTQSMADRWNRIAGATLTVGTPLTKDMAPYWEVPLRPETIEQLVTLDVCYIGAAGNVRMTYQDRELLRRIVDAGVLLWFDDAGGLNFPNASDAPFFPINFGNGSAALPLVPEHSLLNGVFRLTPAEIARLGSAPAGRIVNVLPPASESTALLDPTKPGLARQPVLTPVVGAQNGLSLVAAAQYGSGFLLATAGDFGGAISGPVGRNARAGTAIERGQAEALKLAYNAIRWTEDVTHVLKSPRRNGSSGDQLAGYLERWSFNERPTTYPTWLQPLIVRNQVLAAFPPGPRGPFTLDSFEANPIGDFVGVGQNRDLLSGFTYNRLGQQALADFSWISGLAYGELQGAGYVFVTGGTGGSPDAVSAGTTLIQGFQVPVPGSPGFKTGPNLRWTPPAGSKDVNVRTVWSAPAYFGGLLIAAGGTQGNALETGNSGVGAVGDMRALRLENGQLVEQWHYPQGNAPEVGPIIGPVVVANLFDPRSGATDTTVLYTSLTIASSPGGLGGIVIHTAGEPMLALDDGRTWQPTRRVENWDPNQWWDIRVIDNATGVTAIRYTPATQATKPVQFNVENQPGRIRLPAPAPPTRFTVIAEYSLINTREGSTGGVIRRYWLPAFNLPGGTLPSAGIPAGPTVDAHGNVYMATGNGYVASIRFVGGTPMVNWKSRTDTADALPYLGQQHTVEPYKAGRLIDHLFVSTPAWKDGILYVAGRDGVVYAFETQTDFTIKVPFSTGRPAMTSNRPNSVVLYSNEGDPTITGDLAPRTNRVPPDAFSVNADAGTVTITNMRNVTLDLRRAVAPDQIPQPGLGNRYGIPIAVDYVDNTGAQQSDISYIPLNLLYRFQTGIGNGTNSLWRDKYVFESSPVVAGDHVFVIGNRNGKNGGGNANPLPLDQQGAAVLFQLPADPRKLDNSFIAGKDIGSWPAGAPPGTAFDPARPAGWMVNARPISSTPVLAPPAVADDLLVVATGQGVTAFKAAKVVVADANRVLEVGTDGHAISAMDATSKLTPVGSDYPIPTDANKTGLPPSTALVAVAGHLDRPSMVKHLNRSSSLASIFFSTGPTELGLVGEHSEMSPDSLLIADTGNGRVVETNPAGKVIWELTSFQDPFKLLPPGETLKLSEPMDVQRWVDTENEPGFSGGPLLVIHTLIADSGNTRVIEVVDKINYQQGNFSPNSFVQIANQKDWQGNPVRWYHVLVWSSQSNAQGLRFRYRTAQRVYRYDQNGNLVPNPGVSAGTYPRPVMNQPPFLPMEPYESLTMSTISDARVFYVENNKDARFVQTQQNIPQALPGGDSIVFLLSNRTNTTDQPFWLPDPTSPTGFKYVQGTIGRPPDYPIISEIWTASGGEQVVHQLAGVTSLERSYRVNLADRDFRSASQKPGVYFLIADSGGVFEFRYDPGRPVDPPTAANPFPRDHGPRLAWAFSNDDYNWVTGGGNGNPNALRPGDTGRYVGGRTLTASSARLLTNGQVLIANRTAGNLPAVGGPAALGGELFTVRVLDYANRPGSGPAWVPDFWVQTKFNAGLPAANLVLPSITWRSPSPLDPFAPPAPLAAPGQGGANPLDIGNTYLPDQPAYADLVF